MEREKEFGIHDSGLPDPWEESDEIKRTGEMRGIEPGKYLSLENIPHWFTDIGEEREEESVSEWQKKWRRLTEDFRKLPLATQQTMLDDLQMQMKQNKFRTKWDMLRYLYAEINTIRSGKIKRK